MIDAALIELTVELARDLSPNKITALAKRFHGEPIPTTDGSTLELIGTKGSRADLERLVARCRTHGVSGEVLAAMLMVSSTAGARALRDQSTEFVWTGPTTEFVATRRTEQVLLDLIQKTANDLFMVSFVAYDVKSVIAKVRDAVQRGVQVSVLLEASEDHGGAVDHDGISMLREKVPGISLYGWNNKGTEFAGGRVHAKIAIADGATAFLTSANLTGYAMQRNMEAGFLISGGPEPVRIRSHLQSLIDTQVLKLV